MRGSTIISVFVAVTVIMLVISATLQLGTGAGTGDGVSVTVTVTVDGSGQVSKADSYMHKNKINEDHYSDLIPADWTGATIRVQDHSGVS